MRNSFIALSLLAGTFVLPLLASAQATAGDVNPNASATICVNLQNDLSRGKSDSQTGGEVSVLQIFLQSTSTAGSNTPYLGGDPTGFFGIQTETAVKQFQTDQQLLSSGFVGPLTRARIKALTCTGGATAPNFSATPSGGIAPLSVNFTFQANQPQTHYTVDFGDGQVSGNYLPCTQAGTCAGGTGNVSHTYASQGNYVAQLIVCPTAMCPPQPTVVAARTSIVVTQFSAATTTAALSFNGVTNLQNVDPLAQGTWAWSSVNADIIYATVVLTGCKDPAINVTSGTPFAPWTNATATGTSTSGSSTEVPGARLSGCTASATYSATNSATGASANATAVVRFKTLLPGDVPPSGGATQCVALQNDLTLGTTDFQTNGDVSALQAFLQSTASAGGFPYLPGTPTGYFGFLTQSAVRLFQSEHGLLAAGFVGPATRAQIKTLTCVETLPTDFSATPTSGSAPLAVHFSTRVNDNPLTNVVTPFSIDFGDGSLGAPQQEACTQSIPGSCSYGVSHTYTSAGTYTATLFRKIVCITTPCVGPTIGTVTITVTASDIPPPPEAECTDLQNNLAYRSTDSQSGGEVSLLQAFFQAATSPTTGLQYLTGEPTGFFGQLTKAAVTQFQTDNGLTATGFVDSTTRAKIKEISCHITPPPPPIAECTDLQNDLSFRSADSQTNGEVSLLQAFFQSVTSPTTGALYLTGEPTGFFGQLTRAAVIQFQKDQNLTATGVVGPVTRAKISALTCGDTPPPPPPPPEVCNVDTEMQSCINGAYAARIGPDCSWLACPYNPNPTSQPPTITSFTAVSTNLESVGSTGGSTSLSWATTPLDGTCWMSLNGGNVVSVPTSNSNYSTGILKADTKYSLSCYPNGKPTATPSTKDVTITVTAKEIKCLSAQQPQYVYGYGKMVGADSKPWIRLQGNCSYFTGYSVFDTGWVQGATLEKSGNCPVGAGAAVKATATIDSTNSLEVHSWYGGGYHGSCLIDWKGKTSSPPDPTPSPDEPALDYGT